MVMAHISGKPVMNIQAIGKMVRKMVMVLDISQTKTNMRVSGKIIRETEKAILQGKMVTCTQVIGKMIRGLVKVSKL